MTKAIVEIMHGLSMIILAGCQSAPKWEYKVVYVLNEGYNRTGSEALKYSTVTPDEASLNKLGDDGWELVSSYLEMETAYPNFGSSDYVTGIQPNIRPQRVVLIFKRRK